MSRIQLVYANFHCADAIERSLSTLDHDDDLNPLDVVIVNNGGLPPATVAHAAGEASTVTVLHPPANTGYFGALRYAMQAADQTGYRFRILCNPDIEFLQPDFFSRLAGLTLPPATAIVAPSIESTVTGHDQNPYLVERPSRSLRMRWRMVYSARWIYLVNDRLSAWRSAGARGPVQNEPLPPGPIYAPHGSLMIFDSACLASATEIQAIPFLFAEELFLGEICLRRGWSVRYEPSLQVRHREHVTTGSLPSRSRFDFQRTAALAYLRWAEAGS